MTTGFAALAVILFLSPGIIVREAYFSGDFSRRYFTARPLQEMAVVLVSSVLLHIIFIHLVPTYQNIGVGSVFSNAARGKYAEISDHCVTHIDIITHYFVFIIIWSSWIGFTWQKVVRYFKLDRITTSLRFPNNWHYVFNGEMLDKPGNYNLRDTIKDAIMVDILVIVAGVSYIYSGLLVRYSLGKDAGLEQIVLTDVYRMKRKDYDRSGDKMENVIPVDGKYMVFNSSDILNYNISYLTLNRKKKNLFLSRLLRYSQLPVISFFLFYFAWKQWHTCAKALGAVISFF